MKTQLFRVWVLGVAITGLVAGTGCQQGQARAEVPDFDKLVPEIAPAEPVQTEPAPSPEFVAAAELEKATVSTNMPKLVANPTIPADLKVSPGLEDILKLAQAGVSEEVLLSYINHSTNFFDVSSDAIVYLNDLGVANNVITALIQHDSTPEMQARRQAAAAVQPLPSGVALNTPATNIYPPAVSQTTPAVDTGAAPPPPADAESIAVAPPAEQPQSVSYFYSSLAPYGTWMDVDGYGLCWQPTVVVSNPGWSPYRDRGRWMWSNYGWYWYSDYSWGWAPFHYGRWCDYPRVGWVWVPGTHWGPSWVSWRYSSAYCGWAPLPPACHYYPGYGFSYYGTSIGFGFALDFGLSHHHYSYVPFNRFCDRSPGLHVVRGDRALAVHRQTTVVNNFVSGDNNTIINRGVGRERVAAATRGQVPTATVREAATRAGARREQLVNQGSSLAIVRPSLPAAPEPSHVTPNRAVTRVSANGLDSATATRVNVTEGRSFTGARANLRGSAPQAVTRESAIGTSGGTALPEANSQVAVNNTASGNQRSTRAPAANASRGSSEATPARGNSPMYRSYARPNATETTQPVTRNDSQAAVNNSGSENRGAETRSETPAATRPVTRPQVMGTVPSTATPSASTPSENRSSAVARPNATAGPQRSYANPGVNNRPNATSAPQVTRPTPSASPATRPNASGPSVGARPSAAPSGVSRPSPGVSRPEPSRPNASYSAPVRSTPSYSAPAARPAPSYSAPASRPAPSYSAPASRPAPSYSAPASRSSAPSYSAPVSRGSSGGFYGGGGGGGGRGARGRD